ncbi:flagellar motor protein MotB [Rickettsiales endosymbiont of Stachyamoeba lipophora]|uniref:flagellar motor protein MotB n=1 Tax=Rickettsiales endosymbiont of Stachyamoeba lipophora TaxID=2486578 RepID=UPI000F655142|nr:flagellar motor protein MotB [Rickettsiales endosymbiont of Stachyamoeba lipophora]AZL15370.1 chemotaxis protein MotB [Rickettsiales endosymbiont of Stachyamoeba lipophora]
MADESKPSIIIKKVKKVSGGHHGGAWKVAYADFVTAMMAFFLLLWLLSSVPTEKLIGIADYFTPTVGIRDGKGIGFDGGKSPQYDGSNAGNPKSNQSIVFGAPSQGNIITAPESSQPNNNLDFFSLAQSIKDGIKKDSELAQFSDHIIIDETKEGLRIQVVDKKGRPIFKPGTTQLEPYSKIIFSKLSNIIKYMPNYLAVYGHTNGTTSPTFDHWTISSQRAIVARLFMETSGVDDEQFNRVAGKANRDLLIIDNPNAPENIRISIIMLRN